MKDALSSRTKQIAREADDAAQSRDLLCVGSADAAGEKQVPPRTRRIGFANRPLGRNDTY